MRCFFLVVLPLIALAAHANEPKSITVKTINSVQRGIVPITCAKVDNGTWQVKKVIATGFFVNREGYFLTADHVVLRWDQIDKNFGPCVPAVYIPEVSWGGQSRTETEIKARFFEFRECRYNQEADVAVCKPAVNPFTDPLVAKLVSPLILGNVIDQADGSPVAFTGFPLGFHVPVTSKGFVAAYTAADKKLVIDKAAWPGASGSPVYDGDGRVIGLVIETGLAEGAGLTYSRPVDLIVEFLSKEKVTFEKK